MKAVQKKKQNSTDDKILEIQAINALIKHKAAQGLPAEEMVKQVSYAVRQTMTKRAATWGGA